MGRKRGSKRNKAKQQSGTAFAIAPVDVAVKARNQVARWELNATKAQNTPAAPNANDIIFAINGMAVSATTIWSVLYAIRVKKIVLYSPAIISSSPSAMSFEWGNPSGQSFGNEPTSMEGGSLGTAAGAKLTFVPPKDSVWSKWITLVSPGSVAMFQLAAPAGTTLELWYDCYLENNDSSTSKSSYTGLTVGTNYRVGLDGLASGASVWTVLGYRGA